MFELGKVRELMTILKWMLELMTILKWMLELELELLKLLDLELELELAPHSETDISNMCYLLHDNKL